MMHEAGKLAQRSVCGIHWAGLVLLSCLAVHQPVSADETSLRYRRILVPEADLESQIRGLLPMKREEFDRRIAQALQRGERSVTAPAGIERASYRARWEGNPVLAGTAELEIRSPVENPTLLSLGKCDLALHEATWLDASPKPAIVGHDRLGQCGCLVEGSGTLKLAWSLKGSVDAAGRVSFSVQLPPAVVSTWSLDLPADHALHVEGGIASRQGKPQAPQAATASAAARQTWLVEIAGDGKATLRIEPVTKRDPTQPIVTVRETSTYAILRSTIDLETSLELNSFQQDVPRASLRVDRPLEIVGIRWGDRALSWFVSAADEQAQTILVDLPNLPPGQSLTLVVQAVAPWQTDAPTKLPHVAIVDAVYQEGRATVSAPSWLRLHARPVRGCWQSAVTPSASGVGNDELQFRLHAADAEIEVGADLSPAALREASGTQLIIDAAQVSAVMTAELTSLGGSRFFVEARIPRRWIVDSVEVLPAEALSDRLLSAATPDQQLLRLNLRQTIHESKPLRVIVRGHHRRPPGNEPLPDDFFRLASFSDVRASRRLVAIRSVEPGLRLQLAGDQRLAQLDPDRLPEEEMRLFESLPDAMLFADEGTAGVAATLATAAPGFRAEAAVEVSMEPQHVQHVVKLRCIPESSPVGSLVARLSPKPSGPITWKLTGEDARELEVQYLNSETSNTDSGTDAEYRIEITRARSTPFEITAEWTSPREYRNDVCLASVPEAIRQTGTVEVRSTDGLPLVVETFDVESLPFSAPPDGRFSTIRGSYSYQPGRRAGLTIVSVAPDRAPAAAAVHSLDVRSRFSTGGEGEHEATLQIVNHGLPQLKVHLPRTAKDVRYSDWATGVWTTPGRAPSGQIVVPLPTGQGRVSVQLRYLSDGGPQRWFPSQQFEAPLPQTDLPTLLAKWTVAVGPGFQACGRAPFSLAHRDMPTASTEFVRRDEVSSSWMASFLAPASRRSAATLAGGAEDAGSAESDLSGWNFYQFDLPSGPSASIRVYQPAVIHGLAMALFVLAAAVALRLRRWNVLLPCAIAILLLGLAGPVEWLPLAYGAVFGILGGGLVSSLAASRASPAHREWSTLSTRGRGALFCLALIATCGSIAGGVAADDPTKPTGAGPTVDHRAVIAVDERQQPVGDYVFLSPEFYEQLYRLTNAEPDSLPDWLLISGRYQLPGSPRQEGAVPSIGEITAQIELETFVSKTVVELPFQREQVLLLEGRSRLDGEPMSPVWRDDGSALLIPVESPGKHRLELAFGAPAKKTADAIVLELAIPTIAHTTAVTPLGADPAPTILSGRGGDLVPREVGVREIALGPARNLIVHWPLSETPATAARVEVNQLIWWKLRPGSVVVEGKFRFRPIGGAQDQLRIAFDPRLRLVPGSIVPAPAHFKVEEGAPNVLQISIADKPDAESSIGATWLWVDASGAGNLALPQIVAQGDQVVRSWSAVSVDASLTMTPPPPTAKGLVSADDFLMAWSAPGPMPAAVFDELQGAGPRSIAVLPALALPSVATTTHWSLDRQRALVRFEARLSDVPRTCFQHVLDMPPAVKVMRVALTSGNESIPHRWTQRPDGSVMVTLLADPRPQQLLVVEANIGLVRNRPRLPLPPIEVERAQTSLRQMRIYRQPDVRLRLLDAAGWKQSSAPESGHRQEGFGRLVAELNQSGDAAVSDPSVAVSVNRPEISGRLTTRLTGEKNTWIAEADLDLQIERGVVDAIVLDVPTEWSGPFEITPAVEHRVVPLPGGTMQQILIWPQQAAANKLHLAIRGPLRSIAGQLVRVPDITLRGAPTLERLVILKNKLDGQPLQWETRGLQAIEPDAQELPEGWSAGGGDVYQVSGERFEATPSFPARTRTEARVTLADMTVRRGTNGRMLGRAIFSVELAGEASLSLQMPPGTRLDQLLINGVPAQCWPAGVRTWRLATSSEQLPVVIEALFEGSLPIADADETQRKVSAPRLLGLPVQRTLWTLFDLEPAHGAQPAMDARRTSEAVSDVVRIEDLAANLSRIADSRATDSSPDALQESYQYWRVLYHQARARQESLVERNEQPDLQLVARLNAAERAATEAERRIIQSGLRVDVGSGDSVDVAEMTSTTPGSQARAVLLADDWLGTLAVKSKTRGKQDNARWSTAAIAGGAFAAAWMVLRMRSVKDQISAHAPALLALAGLVWWLVAPWAWLGWILVGAAIWLSMRWPWRMRESTSFVRGRGMPTR